MKTIILTIALFVITGFVVFSQNYVYSEKTIKLNNCSIQIELSEYIELPEELQFNTQEIAQNYLSQKENHNDILKLLENISYNEQPEEYPDFIFIKNRLCYM